MPASSKRPAVKTAGIKIALALAAVGGSLGGWAAMGLDQQATAATATPTVEQVALVVPTTAATATATEVQVAAVVPTATATTAAATAPTAPTATATTQARTRSSR